MGNNCFNDIITNDLQLLSYEMNGKNIELTIEKTKNSLNDKSDLEKKQFKKNYLIKMNYQIIRTKLLILKH